MKSFHPDFNSDNSIPDTAALINSLPGQTSACLNRESVYCVELRDCNHYLSPLRSQLVERVSRIMPHVYIYTQHDKSGQPDMAIGNFRRMSQRHISPAVFHFIYHIVNVRQQTSRENVGVKHLRIVFSSLSNLLTFLFYLLFFYSAVIVFPLVTLLPVFTLFLCLL